MENKKLLTYIIGIMFASLLFTGYVSKADSELEQLHHERLDLLMQKQALLPMVEKLRDVESRIVEIDQLIEEEVDFTGVL